MKAAIKSHFASSWKPFYQPLIEGELKAINGKGELSCLCPLHADTKPSLTVNEHTGKWHCHAEKIGGDAFSFYAKLKGLDIKHDFTMILQ
jgi:DNA primase